DHPEVQIIPARLAEVGGVFLKLGLIGFGGPAAHIALMQNEVVDRRGWVSRERFLDLLGATNLIPGPNSTEMAIHLGFVRAGWWGLLLAGVCFVTPATLIVLACAWWYVRWGALPQAPALLHGVHTALARRPAPALAAFLRADLVERLGWISDAQLLAAVAVGQLTPGPVSTTATFIGYLVAGGPGAVVATLGIFLPSFVLVAASTPLLPKLRASRWAGAFLDGPNAASLAPR